MAEPKRQFMSGIGARLCDMGHVEVCQLAGIGVGGKGWDVMSAGKSEP